MLRRFFKGFSAEFGVRIPSSRAVFAAIVCFFMLSCGGADNGASAREKAQKAADYFARSFALFIPDGYTVGVENYVSGKAGGFHRGQFVIKSPSGREAAAPVEFLLTYDGSRLVLGAAGPFGVEDLEDSAISGFKAAPDSVRGAPVLLVSKNGRIISAERVMDTGVDYAKENMNAISLSGAPVIGAKNAGIAIVEYSDFQCPFCGRAAQSVRKLLGEYEGKAKLVYKQLPLRSHDWAYQASEASLCFHKHGGGDAFRHFHDEVFANQKEITKENHRERFSLIAEEAGLNPPEILLCMDSGEMKKLIERDLKEAAVLGVDGTPTFFVDGIRVPNDFDLLKRAVEIRLSGEG